MTRRRSKKLLLTSGEPDEAHKRGILKTSLFLSTMNIGLAHKAQLTLGHPKK